LNQFIRVAYIDKLLKRKPVMPKWMKDAVNARLTSPENWSKNDSADTN